MFVSFIFFSNGQSSSSTSDSGTDSSKDKAKPARVGPGKPARLTASMDDESGSSSGVDTDSVPVCSEYETPAAIRIVQVNKADYPRSGVSTDKSIPCSDKILSKSSCTPVSTQGVSCTVDGLDERNQIAPETTEDFPVRESEELCGLSLAKQKASNSDLCTSPNQSNLGRLTSDGATQPPDREAVEDIPQVSDVAEDVTKVDNLSQRISSLLSSEQDDPNALTLCVAERHVSAFPLDQTSGVSSSIGSNPRPEGPKCSSNEGVSGHPSKVLSSQYHSSEGDVSDIEADFEESQPSPSQCAVSKAFESGSSLLNNNGCSALDENPSSTSLAATAAAVFDEDEISESANVGVGTDQEQSTQPDVEGAAAVVAPLETAEEQSSESGARGSASASADDTDRSRRRNRPRGRRRRRGKSALYQATEAEAHFMFELAKTVLNKAGGNNSTSVFTQSTSSETHSGPHRVLQLCAFEIGLFALGLHNRTSPNWLSRTYSSHVSWISGQAMEIGHQAITILLERWEGNLTPSEVASIADRASKSNDRAMVRAAAELGLSCLHMATTLNPVEIQRVLSQCRDEDSQLLDQACQAVESAARGGGVYPEVLFDVAKHWFYLHEKNQTSSTNSSPRPAKSESRSRGSMMRSCQSASSTSQSPPVSPFAPQFTVSPTFPSIPPPLYTTPEQYVQQQMHQQVHQMMGHYPAYLSANNSGYRSGSQSHYAYPFSRSLSGTQFSLTGAYAGLTPCPYQAANLTTSSSQHLNRTTSGQPGTQVSFYLNSAYRVGMLALEFLSRRTSDDRPNVKFSRNPSCSEDIRWLCTLSAKLGTSHLQRFCVAALNAVVSPFVLHDLALEAARHMARSNPAQLAVNLRSPTISPLVQKSLTMYAQCIHYNLINISQNDYDEFVELLRHARGAFCMAPGGMTQFNELLQSIRWGHSKKKELWQMIMTGLAKA